MPKTTKTAFYNPLILLTFFGPKKFNDFKVLAVSTKTVYLEKLNVTKMSQRPLGADSAVSSLNFTFSVGFKLTSFILLHLIRPCGILWGSWQS